MRQSTFSRMALLLTLCAPVAWARPPEARAPDPTPVDQRPALQKRLSASSHHSLALAEDGSVWTWGMGLPGDGSHRIIIDKPMRVPTLTDIVAVEACFTRSLALGADGRVWTWGFAPAAVMGLGEDRSTQTTPALVPGLAHVVALSCNSGHTLALRSDGTVWAWGYNFGGELGTGTESWEEGTPLQVPGLTHVVSVAAGERHSLAARADGSVWAWGYNGSGQLGDGTWEDHAPAPVPGLEDVVSVAAGWEHSLALRREGTVWAWGHGFWGQLGIGDAPPPAMSTPVKVHALDEVRAISTHGDSTLALRHDGTVWGWGRNLNLEPTRTDNLHTPVHVQSLNGVLAIARGDQHALVLRTDGSIWGWGQDDDGRVGLGLAHQPFPVTIPAIQGARKSAISSNHVLALQADGSVWAWGSDYYGERGTSSTPPEEQPVPVEGITDAVDVAAGTGSSFILRADGTLWAWGNNASGQLGNGTTTPRRKPQPVPGLGNIVSVTVQPSSSQAHVLALDADGRVWAWGHNASGQLGDGTTTARSSPIRVAGLSGIVAVSVGFDFSLALQRNGQVWAWGNNTYGQLGDGTTTARRTPVRVGLPRVTAIQAGGFHGLALHADGTLWGWGRNREGQLDPSRLTAWFTRPIALPGLPTAVGLAAGYMSSLALSAEGRVWTWGDNSSGQSGRGNVSDGASQRSPPAPIPELHGVSALFASNGTVQAMDEEGTVFSWGSKFLSGKVPFFIIDRPEPVLWQPGLP